MGNALESCDQANEFGIILGEQCADRESLIRDFINGFKHGVELSENTTVDERISVLHQALEKTEDSDILPGLQDWASREIW